MNEEDEVFLAHSSNPAGDTDPLSSHLRRVANRASVSASAFGMQDDAWLAGILHDVGKYGNLFQERLKGHTSHIDHWSAGAWMALTKYMNVLVALSVHGHHVGLQESSKGFLRSLDPSRLSKSHPLGLSLSEVNTERLLERLQYDIKSAPSPSEPKELNRSLGTYTSDMLDVRMLFSALVDADFIETEAHFGSTEPGELAYRNPGRFLQAESSLKYLLSYLDNLAAQSCASADVNGVRTELTKACLSAAASPPGIFSLTAPTGTGKTLAMLTFALKHALKHALRRIIVVIPYLTIIEQTADVYRDVFRSIAADPEQYILEDHSLTGMRLNTPYMPDVEAPVGSLLAQNWDAPIIITTSVQFLESLHANRPAACRKLHRLARSVILFDEVQTLPTHLLVLTLATLSHLVHRYGSTLVLATATQPAFGHLDKHVRVYCGSGWNPSEIVARSADMFDRTRRTAVHWPSQGEGACWQTLAESIASHEQVLCIVNLKRHAAQLFRELRTLETSGVFHLSTNMCPAHRKKTLEEVRNRLEAGMECRLVSTQCVEAGVDLDFPAVYRALGPLDAIAQAAGRCNRNGKLESGNVYVFIPQDVKDTYPDRTYRQATKVTELLLKQRGAEGMDLHRPGLFEEYYRTLYSFSRPEKANEELLRNLKIENFEQVARLYRIIDQDTVSVLVPYDLTVYDTLKEDVMVNRLNRRWLREARAHAVSIYAPTAQDAAYPYLVPVPTGHGGVSDEWFIYSEPAHYHKELGLVLPVDTGCLIT